MNDKVIAIVIKQNGTCISYVFRIGYLIEEIIIELFEENYYCRNIEIVFEMMK